MNDMIANGLRLTYHTPCAEHKKIHKGVALLPEALQFCGPSQPEEAPDAGGDGAGDKLPDEREHDDVVRYEGNVALSPSIARIRPRGAVGE